MHHSRPFECEHPPTPHVPYSPILLPQFSPVSLQQPIRLPWGPAAITWAYPVSASLPVLQHTLPGEMPALSSSAVAMAEALLLLSNIESHPLLSFLDTSSYLWFLPFSLLPFCMSKNAYSLSFNETSQYPCSPVATTLLSQYFLPLILYLLAMPPSIIICFWPFHSTEVTPPHSFPEPSFP